MKKKTTASTARSVNQRVGNAASRRKLPREDAFVAYVRPAPTLNEAVVKFDVFVRPLLVVLADEASAPLQQWPPMGPWS